MIPSVASDCASSHLLHPEFQAHRWERRDPVTRSLEPALENMKTRPKLAGRVDIPATHLQPPRNIVKRGDEMRTGDFRVV